LLVLVGLLVSWLLQVLRAKLVSEPHSELLAFAVQAIETGEGLLLSLLLSRGRYSLSGRVWETVHQLRFTEGLMSIILVFESEGLMSLSEAPSEDVVSLDHDP
jgi:hypothetical protein